MALTLTQNVMSSHALYQPSRSSTILVAKRTGIISPTAYLGKANVQLIARGCQGVPRGASSGDFALRAYYFYNQE